MIVGLADGRWKNMELLEVKLNIEGIHLLKYLIKVSTIFGTTTHIQTMLHSIYSSLFST